MPTYAVAGLEIAAPDVVARFEGRRPLWGYLWPAGMVLAELLAGELAASLRGRAVVELGCGLGAAGLAAARAGATVTLTDAEPEALELAEANARRNHLPVAARLLDWGRVPEAQIGAFDVVVGSDITYGLDQLAPLAGAVAALLGAGGVAWLADPSRLAVDVVAGAAGAAGLSVEVWRTVSAPPRVPTSDFSEDRPVRIYRAWRSPER